MIENCGEKSGEVRKLVEITDCGEADWTEAEDKSKGPSRSAQNPQEAIVKSKKRLKRRGGSNRKPLVLVFCKDFKE